MAGFLNINKRDHIILARYNTDGSLDTGFDTTGQVVDQVGTTGDQQAAAIGLQGDKIIIAGFFSDTQQDILLGRYNSNGDRDTTFGNSSGFEVTDLGDVSNAASLVVQPDGKLVAAGTFLAGLSNYDFALARYASDGSLDLAFGTGGIVTTDFNGKVDDARAVALQADGRIVAAGPVDPLVKQGSGDSDFGVARYLGDDTPPPPPAQADLFLSKSANLTTVKTGSKLTYTLKVKNFGPDSAAGVVLNDPLPVGTTFASVASNQGLCMNPPIGYSGTVSCNLGGIPSGDSAIVTLVVKVTARGRATVTNAATVASTTADPVPGDNTASVQTRVFGSGK